MNTRFVIGLAALGALALAAPARAQDQGDRWNWHGALARGKTLEVRGISGTIQAEPASGSEVQVTAVKTGPAGDRADVSIQMEQTADGVTICARYDGETGCGSTRRHTHRDDHNEAEVEYTVRVPAGVVFKCLMVSGDVDVTGLDAAVTARSVSGDVTVRNVRADVDATSVSGNTVLAGIDASEVSGTSVSGDVEFGGPVRADGRYTFHSVSGELTLRVDGALNARIDLSTVSGELESDFPITLASGGRMHRRSMEFSVGNGGARIDLSTVSGDIQLRQAGQSGR